MTSSQAAILHVALEDLHSGKASQARRLPDLAAKCSDNRLVDLISVEAIRASEQARRIRGASGSIGEPKNLWMDGILNDAERDTRQTQPGHLLDIALIGALRKAKAAEIVSSDTALALARAIDATDLLAMIAINRGEEIETDRLLKERLASLSTTPPGIFHVEPVSSSCNRATSDE